MKIQKNYLVWVYFFSLVLIWGSSFILIKNGLRGYTIWQSATIRLVSAFLVINFFAIRHLRKIPKRKIPLVFLVALFSMFFPAYLFSAAETNLNSSMAGILNALTPLFTSVFAITFWGQSISGKQWLGLAIGFFSTLCLILIDLNAEFSLNQYALLIIIATICYGANINIVKNYLSDVNSFHITTVAVSFAGLLAFLFLPFSDYEGYYIVERSQIYPLISLIILGVLGTAVAQLIQNRLIQKSSVAFASSTTYAIPVVAVLWGLLDGEKLALFHYLGMMGIIAGVWILKENRMNSEGK